jgi:hypothetical protein
MFPEGVIQKHNELVHGEIWDLYYFVFRGVSEYREQLSSGGEVPLEQPVMGLGNSVRGESHKGLGGSRTPKPKKRRDTTRRWSW